MTCPLSFVTKRGSSFGYKRSHILRGRVSIGQFFLGGVIFVYEGCSEDFLNLSFSFSFRYNFLVHWSYNHLVIVNIVFIIDIYIYIYIYI